MMDLKKVSVSFCLLVIAGFAVHAQIPEKYKTALNALQTTVPFLTIAPDSRAGSMGDLGVATTPDANSQAWNPAKYPFISGHLGVSVSYTPWLRQLVNDINLGYVSFYYKFDDQQVLSTSLRFFSLGEIIFRDEQGENAMPRNPNEFGWDVGYSRRFSDNFAGALSFRWIRSDITGGDYIGQNYDPGNSFAVDLGAYYQKEIEISDMPSEFAWGLCLANLGTKISYTEGANKQFIPALMRLGARLTTSLDEYNSITAAVDLNKFLVPTPPIYREDTSAQIVEYGREIPTSLPLSWIQSFYDAPGGFNEEMREIMISGGLEYWYREQFAIRGGYFHEHSTKGNRKYFAVGIGMKLNVLYIDFSYLISATGTQNPLANTMRFTLGFNLGNKSNRK